MAPPPEGQVRHLWPRSSGHFIRAVHAAGAVPAPLPSPDAAPALAPNATEEAQAPAPTEALADALAPPPPDTDLPTRELVSAQWGLVPHWVKSAADGRLRASKLVNAKSETVSTTRAFHEAWVKGQRCIVPMAAFFEDDLRSGKALPTRISRIDGQPMGAAGLWACWTGPDGETILSYTLLTI